MTSPVPVVGTLIKKLHAKREALRTLAQKQKKLEEERDDIAERLIAAMDAQGLTKSGGGPATASISESVVPQVEDWDRFHAFIGKTKRYYLLERRPAVVAYRELLELRKGRKIPGVSSFTKRTVRLLTNKNNKL